jgi:archaellum component FlaC
MTRKIGHSIGLLRAAVVAVGLLGFVVVTPGRPALAENAAALPSPIEEFNTQVGKVKSSLEALNKRIEQSVKEIETLSKPEEARNQVDGLRAIVAEALGLVSDNGEVATFGVKALAFARTKQKELQADTKFAAADRDYLLGEWQRIIAETERATSDLAGARQEFSQLLRTVQTRGDYIEELQAINSAQRMLEVIRKLAGELRSASDVMKSFIRSLSSPGT